MLELKAENESVEYQQLRRCLKVSIGSLEEDIEAHANLHHQICEWHAWAKRRQAKAFASQRSRAATHITASRKTLSEDTSKRAWEASPDYKEATKVWMECSQSVDAWEGLREASLQKSYMIKSLVELVSGGHVSTTIRPRETTKARKRRE